MSKKISPEEKAEAANLFLTGKGSAISIVHLSTKTGHANLKIEHGKKKLWPGHAKTCASDSPPLDRT